MTDSNNGQKSQMVQLTGLWKSQSGLAISGPLGGGRLVIIPNKHKKTDKHPDYIAFLAPNEQRERSKPEEEAPPF